MSLSGFGEQLFGWAARKTSYCSSMWRGDYPDWESALAVCRPISFTGQLSAYKKAFLAVRAGSARYERDSILKQEPLWDWPLLTALAEARADGTRCLRVLDVGGGLASVFYQHRDWLERFDTVRWNVVEVPEVVASGRALVTDPRVRFHESIHAALAEGVPDVTVAAGILPMVPDPRALLVALANTGARRVFIDRIPVVAGTGRDIVTRQIVPRSIYESESPFWFFDAVSLHRRLASHFRILGESTSACDSPVWVGGRKNRWMGYLLEPAATP